MKIIILALFGLLITACASPQRVEQIVYDCAPWTQEENEKYECEASTAAVQACYDSPIISTYTDILFDTEITSYIEVRQGVNCDNMHLIYLNRGSWPSGATGRTGQPIYIQYDTLKALLSNDPEWYNVNGTHHYCRLVD